MINKREFRIKNTKKTLHKVGKRWLVMSTIALGLLGGASAVRTAHASTPVHTSDNTQIHTNSVGSNAANVYNKIAKAPSSVSAQSDSAGSVVSQSASSAKQSRGLGAVSETPNPDNEYNFNQSDKMFDTKNNDYLNNVNHLSLDLNGEAERPQIRVTYGFKGGEVNPHINAPKINSNVISDLNNHQIGVLPLYNPGNSIRQDGSTYPSDNALSKLMNFQNPQASIGYQAVNFVPYRLLGYLFTAPRDTQFAGLFKKYFYPQTDNGYTIDNSNSYFVTNNSGSHTLPADLSFPDVPNTDGLSQNQAENDIDLEYQPQQAKVTVHYVDADTNMPIANDKTVESGEAKTASEPITIKGFKYVATKNNGNNVTLTYNFSHYKHPNHAKGDIDVFYFDNNALKQYRDYGNYPVGTEFNLGALRKAGFKIVTGNNVTKFNNGVQTVVLTNANPKKAPKKLPRVSKVIGSATDYVNYVDGNKVVANGYTKAGKATKLDSDLLTYGSDFTAKKFDKLPSSYQISSDTFNKYNNYFSMIPNSNFGGTQLNIPVELKVQPKPKSQTSTVTVIFTNNKGDIIKKDKPVTGVVGKQFNMIGYEDQIPAGYEMTGTKNAQYFYPKTNQTVQIVLGKARSQIMVYYYNIENNQQLKQPEESDEPEGTKFNINNHLDNLPKGYQFVKATGVNGSKVASDFTSNTQTVDVYLKKVVKPVTVTVHYVDENGKTIASDNTYQGMPNANFQFNFKTIPYYSIDYSKLNQDNLIKNAKYPDKNWVSTLVYKSTKPAPKKPVTPNKPNKPVTPKKPAKPQVQMVTDYVIYTYNGKQVGKTAFSSTGKKGTDDKAFTQFADNFGSDFINSDANELYKNAGLPQGYKLTQQTFSDYGSDFFNNSSYTRDYGSNIYKIPVITVNNKPVTPNKPNNNNKKPVKPNNNQKPVTPKKPQVTTSNITVNYVDNDKNKVIKSVTVSGQDGNEFDLIKYEDAIPTGYNLEDIQNGAYFFTNKDQTTNLILGETRGRIYLNFVNDDDKGNTVKTVTLQGLFGTKADTSYDNIMSYIPAGYEYKNIENSTNNTFSKNDQTITINLLKPQAKVAKSTITVNYLNNGKVIKSAKVTEPVSTDFDIGEYLNDLPADYEYAGMRNNVTDFGYNDHTVNILLDKDPEPSSASAKPSSKANVKPSSAKSSNGSKASSASTKPSSASKAPSSKANHKPSNSAKPASKASVAPSSAVKPNSKASQSSSIKPSSAQSKASSKSSAKPSSASVKPSSKASVKPSSKSSAEPSSKAVTPKSHASSASARPSSASARPSSAQSNNNSQSSSAVQPSSASNAPQSSASQSMPSSSSAQSASSKASQSSSASHATVKSASSAQSSSVKNAKSGKSAVAHSASTKASSVAKFSQKPVRAKATKVTAKQANKAQQKGKLPQTNQHSNGFMFALAFILGAVTAGFRDLKKKHLIK